MSIEAALMCVLGRAYALVAHTSRMGAAIGKADTPRIRPAIGQVGMPACHNTPGAIVAMLRAWRARCMLHAKK